MPAARRSAPAVLVLALALAPAAAAAGEEGPRHRALVELFTSQG